MGRHESAIYVSLKNHLNYQEEMLHNLERLSLICIDDVDLIAGDLIWEEALFHLYNESFLRGTRLLMAGQKLPIHLDFKLSDLSSRLAWGLSLKVEPLVGQEALKVLKAQADEVGMALPSEVSNYLLQRSRQDMASLGQVIKIIKQASLEHRRKVTVPFVKQVMGW
jgi:DnaA family protein